MAEANRDGDEVTLKLSVDEAILIQVMVGMSSTRRENSCQRQAWNLCHALNKVLGDDPDEVLKWIRVYEAACDGNEDLPTIHFSG